VPNSGWFEEICNGSTARDVVRGTFIKRGSGSFVRDPLSPARRCAAVGAAACVCCLLLCRLLNNGRQRRASQHGMMCVVRVSAVCIPVVLRSWFSNYPYSYHPHLG
jgi:hypothetical protein